MSFEDYHIHTSYSKDSEYEIEDVIKDAIALGINELCFTDHLDSKIDPNNQNQRYINIDVLKYIKEYERLKIKYQDKINLKMGFEFGYQAHTKKELHEVYRMYDYDFVILSIHNVQDMGFGSSGHQQFLSQDEYNLLYYNAILEAVKNFKDYSVLGHLDYIVRYDKNGIYPFYKIKDIVREILKEVIKDNKGIEVNTSSFRYGLKDLTPSKEILKLYLELGGKIITIGSDSHAKDHLGKHINEVKKELKKLGFKTYCTFDKMKAIYHNL